MPCFMNELLNLKWTQVDWDLNKVLSPGDHNYEREPISKIQESILRLEIEELKKNK